MCYKTFQCFRTLNKYNLNACSKQFNALVTFRGFMRQILSLLNSISIGFYYSFYSLVTELFYLVITNIVISFMMYIFASVNIVRIIQTLFYRFFLLSWGIHMDHKYHRWSYHHYNFPLFKISSYRFLMDV